MNKTTSGVLRESKNRAYFDQWAQHYDEGRISRWFQYTQKLAIDVLDITPTSKILDVGCGTGYAVLYLGSVLPHGKACGIDISSRMIETAQAKIPASLRDRVEFRQANSDNVPYASEEFDHLLCTNSFHHYPDPLRALGEMRRVLKPGGQAVIFENAPDLSWYTWAWDRVLHIIETGHVRYYTSAELGAMLRQAGFVGVTLHRLKNEFLKHGKLFASIQLWSCTKPVAD